MDDLEIAANQFKAWRGDRRYYRYPTHFWNQIQKLAEQYSLDIIAKTFEINPQYLKQKMQKVSQPLSFAPVTVISTLNSVSVEFIDCNSHPITMRFQADLPQLIHMIQSLTCGVK